MGPKRRNPIENDLPNGGFSPRRGFAFFVWSLFLAPLIYLLPAYLRAGEGPSVMTTIVVTLGTAILAGLIGMFTENIPF